MFLNDFISHFILAIILAQNVYSEMYDLTHPFNNDTQKWPSTKNRFLIFKEIKYGDDEWYQSDYIRGETHSGTHLDAPIHFSKNKWSVSDIPIENFIVPGVIIDVTKKTKKFTDYLINVDDVKDWIRENGAIPEKALILFHTGWAKFYSDPNKYFGIQPQSTEELHFPGVHPSLAQWFIDNTNIVGLGIDTASMDYGLSKKFESHRILSSKNIYILENLMNLNLKVLPKRGLTMYIMPMKIDGASGAPCRVLAKINPVNSGSSTYSTTVFCVLISFLLIMLKI